MIVPDDFEEDAFAPSDEDLAFETRLRDAEESVRTLEQQDGFGAVRSDGFILRKKPSTATRSVRSSNTTSCFISRNLGMVIECTT
jgi:hypothetical protein